MADSEQPTDIWSVAVSEWALGGLWGWVPARRLPHPLQHARSVPAIWHAHGPSSGSAEHA